MKKVLAIFLAFIIGLSMSAQIQNKLLGFTLGSTTKAEVYENYKNEKHFMEKSDSYSVGGTIEFAGQKWNITTFTFYHDRLLSVQFSLIDLGTSISIMDSTWDYLRLTLLDKYGDFNYYSTSEYLLFQDDQTHLALSYTYSGNNKALTLIYSDRALREQKRQAEEDEL